MVNVKKILYPTDFSSYSNQAYFHAVALAETHGASLTVLYVYSGPKTDNGTVSNASAEKEYWQSQLEQIRPANLDIPVSHVLIDGDPATEIARYAADAQIDLIVMGTHGRSGLERMLMGSVAEQTLRNAPCSVMIAKLPKGMPEAEPAHVEMAAAG